jgi:hypothetical protein
MRYAIILRGKPCYCPSGAAIFPAGHSLLRLLFILLFANIVTAAGAQVTGSFVINGSISNYYPVIFTDHAWDNNVATEMTLGRSNVHDDATWRGAIIAKFRFHTTQWGHGANFFDADVRENTTAGLVGITNFVGGWMDATQNNGSYQMVVWLRGGTTTYYYTSNYAINPAVYDGVQNALPFVVQNGGPSLTYKTAPDPYVNVNGINVSAGITSSGNLSATGSGYNYFAGTVGIGTATPGSNVLAVEGTIGARKVVVTQTNPFPDYVFEPGYMLTPLDSLRRYVESYRHLPDIPSAGSVEKNGLDLGGNQAALLKKIEELTLYILDQDKRLVAAEGAWAEQNRRLESAERRGAKQDKVLKEQGALLEKQQTRIRQLEGK